MFVLSESRRQEYRYRPFRFEVMWLCDPKREHVVKQRRETPVFCSPSHQLVRQLDSCPKHLGYWNKSHFGNFNFRIQGLQTQISALQSKIALQAGPWPQDLALEKYLLLQYDLVLHKKNIHWAQKARVEWLHFGDNNTSSVHASVNRKRASSKI